MAVSVGRLMDRLGRCAPDWGTFSEALRRVVSHQRRLGRWRHGDQNEAIVAVLERLANVGGRQFDGAGGGSGDRNRLIFQHGAALMGLAQAVATEAMVRAQEERLASESRQLGAVARRARRAEEEADLALKAGRSVDAERWAAQAMALRSEAAAIGADRGTGGPAGYAPLGRPAGGAERRPEGDAEMLRAWLRDLSNRDMPMMGVEVPRLSLDGHMAMMAQFGGAYLDVPEGGRGRLVEAVLAVQRGMGGNGRVLAADGALRRLRERIMAAWLDLSAARPTFPISSHLTLHGGDAVTHGGFHDFVRAIEAATGLGKFSLLARSDWGDWSRIHHLISNS
jgi:hypothetical protein